MNFESFSSGDSVIHRLDTRIKLVSALALIVAIALCRSFPTASAGLLIAALIVLSARLPARSVMRRLLLVNGFVAFLWVTLPLSYPGTSLFALGPVSISREGVLLAALISVKTNAALLVLIGLLATSSLADIGNGLATMKVPPKLCLLLLFSYRYIFVIHQEYLRLVRAARLRCFSAGTNMHTYRTTGYLFGMTLIRSHHRAHRVKQAMVLRGFQGRFHALYGSTIGRAEITFGLLTLLGVAGLIFLELACRP